MASTSHFSKTGEPMGNKAELFYEFFSVLDNCNIKYKIDIQYYLQFSK